MTQQSPGSVVNNLELSEKISIYIYIYIYTYIYINVYMYLLNFKKLDNANNILA